MASDQEHRREDRALRSLEDELRRLPKLEVPETLEARLLAAIPRMPTETARRRRIRWRRWTIGAVSAAAAAALIIAAVMLPLHRSTENFQKSMGVSTDTSPPYVLGDRITRSEETRPCDILPPLPDWHRQSR